MGSAIRRTTRTKHASIGCVEIQSTTCHWTGIWCAERAQKARAASLGSDRVACARVECVSKL